MAAGFWSVCEVLTRRREHSPALTLCYHGYRTGLDELLSSEDDEDDESPCSGGAVTMTTQREEAEPGPSSRSVD